MEARQSHPASSGCSQAALIATLAELLSADSGWRVQVSPSWDLEPLQCFVARGRAFVSDSRALRLRSTERPRAAAGQARRQRSGLGRDFLPPGQDNRTTHSPHGAPVSLRSYSAAMGSLLSSDSSKSASAAPRTPERSGHPELPITSFDCSVCLEVLHQPVRTRCGHV